MSKVNRNEFADIVGYSPKWIGTFIDEGMPHEGGGGRGKPMVIDTAEAIKWLVERELKKQLGEVEEEQNTPRAGTKDGEELLLTKAKRRKAEVEAKKAEDAVMDLPDVAQFLFAIATLYGNELNGLGARLASEVAVENEPAKCKHIIDVECRRVRAATAESLRGFVAEYRAKRSGYDAGTTDAERGGVGDE